MKIFPDIPFQLNFEEFSEKIHLNSYRDCAESAEELFHRALPLIRPRAVYMVCYVRGRTVDTVDLEETFFESRVMSANLNGIERVFPYIATCGNELEDFGLDQGDMLSSFWLDALKEMALSAAVRFLKNDIAERFALKQLSSMNPGAGDRSLWPIHQQRKLFSLFGDVESLIGVRLTKSFLMMPIKSLSGLFFPTEVPFESCQLCTRENCPGRRAPYQGTANTINAWNIATINKKETT